MALKQFAVGSVKRLARNVAPGASASFMTWLIRRSHQTQLAAVDSTLTNMQQRFDEQHPIDLATLRQVASDSSVIVFGSAPFIHVSAVIDALSKERVVPGQLVIVDTTAELLNGAAISAPFETWRFQLPLTQLTVVKYTEQDVNYPAAMELGAKASELPHLWFAGRDLVPLPRSFEYLLKTYIAQRMQAAIAGWTMFGNGSVLSPEIPEEMLRDGVQAQLLSAEAFVEPFGSQPLRGKQLATLEPIAEQSSFVRGLFGGPRRHFLSESNGPIFDPLFFTEAAVGDLSLRLREQGIRIFSTAASLSLCSRHNVVDGDEPWQGIHDWRWLVDKRVKGASFDVDRIEMVCPFHRGDVVLATQLAAHLRKKGQAVRLHVAKGLESWVKNFDPEIDVETIPVAIPAADYTYRALLASYKFVSQRLDASPRIARGHPSRSLSDTGRNLVEYMLEQMGMSPDALVGNAMPEMTDEDSRVAEEMAQQWGDNLVFIHPFGGWGLKSIPSHVMADLAKAVHDKGLKLVQIGGATDTQLDLCDHAILQNYLPSRWRAIFAKGRGLIGVDSWTAHFASILDVPQMTFFGSTHPRHVKTKQFFARQDNAAIEVGPRVNCSPCNSLTCIAYPKRDYCTGYAFSDRALDAFLQPRVASARHS